MRRAPCPRSAGPRRSPSAGPPGTRPLGLRPPGVLPRPPPAEFHVVVLTPPVGRIVRRDVGEVEQPGLPPLQQRLGLGGSHPLLFAQLPAARAQLGGPGLVTGLLGLPHLREISLTSARMASAAATRALHAASAASTASTSAASTPRRASAAFTASGSARRARISITPAQSSLRRRASCRGDRPYRALRARRYPRRGRRCRPDRRRGRSDRRTRAQRGRQASTVETLEGYRRPAAGRVRVLGLDPQADHAALSGRVGVMLQRGGVYPMLGPRRVLQLFAGYYPAPVPTEELLDLVGLRGVATTPWRHLSGASSSASHWRWPWSDGPRSHSWTSRRPASTPRAASPYAPWWPDSGRRASASSLPPTSWARPRRWLTAS